MKWKEASGILWCLLHYIISVLCKKCPLGWEEFEETCYKFTWTESNNYAESLDMCRIYNSYLLSVDTMEEHDFITNWLTENDPRYLRWYTSGHINIYDNWVWNEDNNPIILGEIWLPHDGNNSGSHAAYKYSPSMEKWGLVRVASTELLAYICEVHKNNLHGHLDLDYGMIVSDQKELPRGPYFIKEPKSAIFDITNRQRLNEVDLKCVAEGFPHPTYKWYKVECTINCTKIDYLDPLSDSRYTQTDGTLKISNPTEHKDDLKYFCVVSNEYGTITSNILSLNFGYISEFGSAASKVEGKENWGMSLSCNPPTHYPGVSYLWIRDSYSNIVQQDERVFLSYDGNLYFSVLEKHDQANYSCKVKSSISGFGRTGPSIELRVKPTAGGQKLQFPVGFPKIFGDFDEPLLGKDVRLECFAFGYPIAKYVWERGDSTKELPPNSILSNKDRVLTIRKIKLKDIGEYNCTVKNAFETIQQSVFVNVKAHPEIIIPLGNKIVSFGEEIKWYCEAFGLPDVTYSWLKNGVEIKKENLSPGDVYRYEIRDNVLTIKEIQSGDQGMYQCRAKNYLGSIDSIGQLKVIMFPPTFQKYPLEPEMLAVIGGNITIACRPEGGHPPTISWTLNDRKIPSDYRHKILKNGYLSISGVQMNDHGSYTCLAENKYGSAQSTGLLIVLPPPEIEGFPTPRTTVVINGTLSLQCRVYTNFFYDLEVAYVWKHNNLKIDFDKQEKFSLDGYFGDMFIDSLSMNDAGVYTCEAKTAIGYAATSTEVIVVGPPESPGGIMIDYTTNVSTRINFIDGPNNGSPITAYIVEGRTNRNPNWTVLASNISYWRVDRRTNRKEIVLSNVLSPESMYNFRITAINNIGVGWPSDPSPQCTTDEGVIVVAPSNVGGGGGKYGALTVTWDPLSREDWNAPNVWYKVYYRRLGSDKNKTIENDLFNSSINNLCVVSVGMENYYKEYIVQVQAFNSHGPGPISEEVVVFSAEILPKGQVTGIKVKPFNSSALVVSWSSLEDHREITGGKLSGYRIKYWKRTDSEETDTLTLWSRTLEPTAIIIGLQPYTEYWVVVMPYNSAGSGLESERFLQRTHKAAPQRAPTGVQIEVLGPTGVLVLWRGVTTSAQEETVIGYKIRYWPSREGVTYAKEIIKCLDGTDLKVVVSGLVQGRQYKLRILAFSLGGDGRMSSPVQKFYAGSELVSKYMQSSAESSRFSFSELMFILITSMLYYKT